MRESHLEVLQLAERLASRADLPPPRSVVRLSGGKNNRVWQIGDAAVLKLYHWDPRDSRGRLRAEWNFLIYARAHSVENVPRPRAQDPDAHAALYSRLPGRPLSASEIGPAQVDAALSFVLAVNRAPRELMALDPGSEACLSLDEHIATIDRRVARLGTIDPAARRRSSSCC